MKVKLQNIASLQMGYTFRSKLINQNEGNVSVVQMKDLSDDNTINTDSLIKTHLDKIDDRHFVELNDLVFRSRGQNNNVVIMKSDCQNIILAAPLFKIKIKTNDILPEYLLWFINHQKSQSWMSSRREGSHGGMISKKTLEDLEIFIPSIKKQNEILQIIQLRKREETVTGRLVALRNKYYSNVLLKIAKGE